MVSRLGINNKNPFIQNLLGDLAFADCYHDFSDSKMFTKLIEKISTIKKISDKDVNGKAIVDYINKQISNENPSIKTIYSYFEKTDLLTPATEKLDNKELKENKILDNILGDGIYKGIKEMLKNNEKLYLEGTQQLPKDSIMNINIQGQIIRNYKYSLYPTKKNGEYYNLPYSYREVSNNNNFILLDDASFFSFSSLRDEDILLKITKDIGSENLSSNDINRSYTFYFIKNSENLADSAKKTSLYNKGNQRIKIKILKDKANYKIKFPAYTDENFTQNINYFSSIELNTEKKEKEIEADVNYPTLPKKHYTNISFLGSRNEAALNTLIETYNLKYNPFEEENSEDISNKNKKLETLIYLLLKRFGDWSQALSLLDRERTYEIYDYDTDKKEGETTLDQLKTKEKADIAIVTHDRILFAYSILLGLNVFFSLKTNEDENDDSSTIWNIYFKNTDDVMAVDKSIYEELSSEESLLKYIKKIEKYAENANNIYNKVIEELQNIPVLKPLPEDIIYDTVKGGLVYNTTFINPLKLARNDCGIRKPYEQQNVQRKSKKYIETFKELIVRLRKNLIVMANLTSLNTLFEESKKVKEFYDNIKKNPNKNELYKDLNESYSNIEQLNIINNELGNIYTVKEQENDKNIIQNYFEYIDNTNQKDIIKRDEIINDYITLLKKINNNFNTSINILDEVDYDVFLNFIPHIDELLYNNIIMEKDLTNSICRFLKELRNEVTEKETTKDAIVNPSSYKGRKLSGSECNPIIMSHLGPEDMTFKCHYYKKAVEIATKLKEEGKPYNIEIYVPLEEEKIPNPMMVEEPVNLQKANTQRVNSSNNNSNVSQPRKKPRIQSGGYKIEYVYNGKGKFYSTFYIKEKDHTKKFILLYLDSLYSRLFSLKQYSNGGDDKEYPSFDDNVYEEYLIIYKELKNIESYLESNNLSDLTNIYYKKRYQWKAADLKPYMKELDGGLDEVDDQLHKYYENLHYRVTSVPVVNTNPVSGVNTIMGTATRKKNLKRGRNNSQTRRGINNSVNTGENTEEKNNRRTRVKEKRQKNSRRKTRNKHGISQTGLSKAEKRRLLFQQMRVHY